MPWPAPSAGLPRASSPVRSTSSRPSYRRRAVSYPCPREDMSATTTSCTPVWSVWEAPYGERRASAAYIGVWDPSCWDTYPPGQYGLQFTTRARSIWQTITVSHAHLPHYQPSSLTTLHRTARNQFAINFWSSIIAGASSTIVTNPIWVIKTRLMSQSSTGYNRQMSVFPRSGNTPTSRPTINSPWHYKSTLDAARKMYSSEGVLSFYSGLTPALLGLTHVAVQFPAYEFLRKKFTGEGMGEMTDATQQSNWLGVLSASILSKIMASSATYPHEVIRTRLQTQRRPTPGVEYLQGLGISESTAGDQPPPTKRAKNNGPQPKYRGVVMTFRTILREEGWRAFYAGMGVNMMRAVPAATVTMMTYEYVMKSLHHTQAEGRRKIAEGADARTIAEP